MIQWYLLLMLFSFNYIFLIIKHPLSMSLILMIQTLIISMLSNLMSMNSWFSYILFLIFVGALLILFIYITSLTSNKLFNFSYKMLIIPMILFLMFMQLNKNLFMWNFINSDMLKIEKYNYMLNYYELIMLFNFPSNMMILMIMLYLLFTLISIIKITKFNKGPMRKMN
uniref:NADH dehydrogenase subunit 6 n=1 Tax=Phthiridium szechuanum TaxID=2982585 RepID=UPI0022378E8E|nr:NADH dehydrogenase subunit 6 [Phthiridium szechuanum]UYP50985.1 NADH dehydrogenase subunit 6 [Phthiridium szechuanum]